MVYIIGHTRKEYLVKDILLPKKSYTEFELARGRKAVVPMTDEEWAKIKDLDYVVELLAQHSIEVLDAIPIDRYSALDLQEALRRSELDRSELQSQYDGLQVKYNSLQAEAVATIKELQDKIKVLEGSK